MKRRQEEIVVVYNPVAKRIKLEPRAVGAGDDGFQLNIQLLVCGKCNKLRHEKDVTYIKSTDKYLCTTCDTKG